MDARVQLLAILLTGVLPCRGEVQWGSLDGPEGGAVHALAEDSSGSLWAGIVWGGAFRSDDTGKTWIPVFTGMSTTQVTGFAVAPSGDVYCAGSNGVLQASPAGDAWLGTGYSSPATAVAVNAQGDIFAAGSSVLRRLDGESSWSRLDSGITGYDHRVVVIDGGGNVYVGGWGNGVFVSADNGESFQQRNTGLSVINVQSMAVTSDNRVFAGTWGGGVFRSDDTGQSWTAKNTGLSDGFILSLTACGSDTLVAGTSDGCFISIDTGETWTRVDSGFGYNDTRAVLISTGRRLFAGTEGGGVYLSADFGATWSQQNTGLAASYVRTLLITPQGDLLAGTSGSGLWSLPAQSSDWQRLADAQLPPTASVYAIAFNALGDWLLGTRFSGLLRSGDGGSSWERLSYNSARVEHIVCDRNGYLFAGSGGSGVWRSKDNGDSWEALALRSTTPIYVRGLALGGEGALFAATSDSGVYVSSDTGDTWTQANTGLARLRCWSMGSGSRGDVYVGTERGLYRTIDNGQHWVRLDSASLTYTVYAVHVHENAEIYAGTSSSLWSSDSGKCFTRIDGELFNKNIASLTTDSLGTIYAGTGGNGVYRSPSDATVVADSPRRSRAETHVHVRRQGGSRLEVRLERHMDSPVSVALYSLAGQRMAVQPVAATCRFTIDMRTLARGVYQLVVTAGNRHEVVLVHH